MNISTYFVEWIELCIDGNAKSMLCRYFGMFIGGCGISLASSMLSNSWLDSNTDPISDAFSSVFGTNSGMSNTCLRSRPLRIT